MNSQHRLFIQISQITLVTLLIVGCLAVLWPFTAAILFAAIICVTTWPIYNCVLTRLRGRATLAALTMVLLLCLVVLIPTIFLSLSLADNVERIMDNIRPMLERGPSANPPEWLSTLPFVGKEIESYWHKVLESKEELNKLVHLVLVPTRTFLLNAASLAGQGILQLALVIFIAFFLYRDGQAIGRLLKTAACKLGGELGGRLLNLARGTVNGVMIGIVGTAVAQAIVALIGFLIAGIPGALLLGAATFFLSMVPVGPPLIWGGAAFWLYDQGETGWAIFLVLYGLLVISSVDNFVKPMLISRSADLPILLIALGVFGGILVFGFVGIFLGPTLLALGYVLANHWTSSEPEKPALVTPDHD